MGHNVQPIGILLLCRYFLYPFAFFKGSYIKHQNIDFDVFFKVFAYYSRKLELSIEQNKAAGILLNKRKRFYNFIIMKAKPFYKILEYFVTGS